MLVVFGLGTSGCTGGLTSFRTPTSLGALSLVAFNSCDDALQGLRQAAEASVGPYGLPGNVPTAVALAKSGAAVPEAAPAAGFDAAGRSAADSASPDYSRTNDHEIGVDEPDLVKTDGRRIVTLTGGVLRVVDVATRTLTGELNLAANTGGYLPANLLLDGNHVLVLVNAGYAVPEGDLPMPMPPIDVAPGATGGGASSGGGAASPGGGGGKPMPVEPPVTPIAGPRLLLVDITGKPSILGSFEIDGGLVDARQVDDTVRVVVSSTPRIAFPSNFGNATETTLVAANRSAIAHADLSQWLPRIQVTDHGKTRTSTVPCGAVRRPASFSGGNLLTVLTFDMSADNLGSGLPVSIAADGDTVYATPQSLYVASDDRWRYPVGGIDPGFGVVPPDAPDDSVRGDGTTKAAPTAPSTPREHTTIYRFDTSGSGRPTFVAAGRVPGYLVNQYAMSEWNKTLRLATTTGTSWSIADGKPTGAQTSSSAVYALSISGPEMSVLGSVGGLGVQERIYAVRFIGPVAYVVTFRQTDPLYTVDMSDPAHPQVRGALELTGYSAYLHPASDTRLIGVGRQADPLGHVGGLQVSLFDVTNLSAPSRVDTVSIDSGASAAEFDPHAFLYWPSDGLVVVPLLNYGGYGPSGGVLVLHVSNSALDNLGFLDQPVSNSYAYQAQISRSLVIGGTLWTVSDAGLMGNSLTDLSRQAWLPFG